MENLLFVFFSINVVCVVGVCVYLFIYLFYIMNFYHVNRRMDQRLEWAEPK